MQDQPFHISPPIQAGSYINEVIYSQIYVLECTFVRNQYVEVKQLAIRELCDVGQRPQIT